MNLNDKYNEKMILEEFRKREIRQYITIFLMLLVYPAIILISAIYESHLNKIPKIILYGIILALLAPVVYIYYNWRCPRCGSFLGKRFLPKFCNICGAKLR
ncbi:hypothetical protein [Maledivibacter halophilus]|uniref:Zinc-ribbon domain-containing protein n=1 Tax=Maledivibacter halophilus TaxID=36842 RepID=A0A1T5KRK3_9FIRM|nr:hypothetical protein [Maledivibacter halophilus]SKC66291.1 hypothetical protein SAMN02194393_02093 [Maledivibacter halophilus]